MKKILLSALSLISIMNYSQDLTSNLKVCMPFNGNASDVSGAGNNGTVSGATLTTDRFGNASKAYQFNGTSDFISIANFANVAPTNELTISMWAKSDLTTSNCLFMLSPDNVSDRCVGCAQYSNSGSTMMIWDYGNLSGGRLLASGIPIDLTGWHHYVYLLSQTGNLKEMYLDGALKLGSTYALSCSNKSLPFYIGAANDGGAGGSIRFHGKIDDVCIYNRALNANEVSALFSGTGVCFSVGLEELTNISNGILYPTISGTGIYSYSGEISKLISIEVYTIDGKTVKTYIRSVLSENQDKLDLSYLSNGLYFVKLVKSEGNYIQKIVIEK